MNGSSSTPQEGREYQTKRIQRLRELIEKADRSDKSKRISRTIIRVSKRGNRGAKNERNKKGGRYTHDFISPDLQNVAGREHAARLGIDYDEENSIGLADIDQTASKRGSWLRRPNLQQHLKDAEDGKFTDAILFKASRFAREMSDGLEVVEAFSQRGIRLHFLGDSIPEDLDSALGKIALSMTFAFAEQASKDLGDYLSAAIKTKWTEYGKPHGRPHCWLNFNEDGEYEINQEGWAFARRVVEIGLQGLPYREGARRMNAENFKTPAYNKAVTHDTFTRMLSVDNIEKMLGTALSWPIDEQGTIVRLEDAWPALISPEEAAVLRLNYHSLSQRRTPRNGTGSEKQRQQPSGVKMKWALPCSGILRCAYCGREMYAGSNRNGSHKNDDPGKKPSRFPIYCCPAAEISEGMHAGLRFLTVTSDGLDQAVLRAVAAEYDIAPEGGILKVEPKRQEPAKPKQRSAADVDRDIEALMAKWQIMPERQYEILSKRYEEERESLLSAADDAKLDEIALKQAATIVDDERQMQRLTIHATVAEAKFPYVVQGKRIAHRCVWIRMKNGSEYLSPVYRATHKSIKDLYPYSVAEHGPLVPPQSVTLRPDARRKSESGDGSTSS